MTTHCRKEKNTALGMVLGIIAILSAALLAGCVKAISFVGLATQQIIFFQSLVALAFLLPWIFKQGKQVAIPKNKILICGRSLTGLTFLYLFYVSVRLTPLVNAVLLKNTAPLFIPVMMCLIFKKKLTLKKLAPVLIGFTGVVLVLNPGKGFLRPGDMVALSAGLVSAAGFIMVGRLEDKGERVSTMMLFYLITTILITGIWCIPSWKSPAGIQWWYLLAIGALYAIYQVLLLIAIKLSSPVVIAPIIYFGVVFSGVIDWIGWKQVPTGGTILGSIIVIAGAALSILQRKKA